MDNFWQWMVVAMITFGLFVIVPVSCNLNKDNHATSILQKKDLFDIQWQGYQFFACSKGDWFNSRFTATKYSKVSYLDPKCLKQRDIAKCKPLTKMVPGNKISGVICCGIWKSCTIRY